MAFDPTTLPGVTPVASGGSPTPFDPTSLPGVTAVPATTPSPPPAPNYMPITGQGVGNDVLNALSNAGAWLESWNAPGTKIGEAIGTLGGYGLTSLTDPNAAKYYDLSAPTPLQVGADAANAVLTAAMPEAAADTVPLEGASDLGILSKGTRALSSAPVDVVNAATKAIGGVPGEGIRGGMMFAGGSGALQSIANGNTDPNAVLHDALVSSLFGGALGLGGNVLGSVFGNMAERAGISTKMQNLLADSAAADPAGTAAEWQKNLAAAKGAGEKIGVDNPYGYSQDQMELAGSKLKEQLNAAKAAKGQLLRENANAPVSLDIAVTDTKTGVPITNPATGGPLQENVLDKFKQQVAQRFGYTIQDDFAPETATRVAAAPGDTLGSSFADYMNAHDQELSDAHPASLVREPGSLRKLPISDQNRILSTYKDLAALQANPTVRATQHVIDNLDDISGQYKGADLFGVNHDQVDGFLHQTRHDVNMAMRQSSPAIAAANDATSQLHQLDDFLGREAGSDLSRGQLLMRRVFYGDKSKSAVDLLNKIKQVTGVDLVRQAGLAKLAIDLAGDAEQRTGLRQALAGGMSDFEAGSGVKSRVLGAIYRHTIGAIHPSSVNIANALAEGHDYGFLGISQKLDQMLETPEGQKIIAPIASAVDKLSSGSIGTGNRVLTAGLGGKYEGPSNPSEIASHIAKRLIKTSLYNRMAQPSPQGAQ